MHREYQACMGVNGEYRGRYLQRRTSALNSFVVGPTAVLPVLLMRVALSNSRKRVCYQSLYNILRTACCHSAA